MNGSRQKAVGSKQRTELGSRKSEVGKLPLIAFALLATSYFLLPTSAIAGTRVTATYDLGQNPHVMATVNGTPQYGLVFAQRNKRVTYGGVEYGPSVVKGYLNSSGQLNDGAGNLWLDLIPNLGATPGDSYYVVTFNIQGRVHAEIWVVPELSTVSAEVCRQAQAPSSTAPALFYQFLQQEGEDLPQRQKLNFAGGGVSCADSAGQLRTNCTFSGGGGGSVPKASATVSGTVKTDVTASDPVVYLQSSTDSLLAGKVSTTRTVSTSSPLGGGGALSADLTLTCTTCEVTGSKNAASGYAGLTGSTKINLAQMQEVMATADLSDLAGLFGTTAGTKAVTTALAGDPTTDNCVKWIAGGKLGDAGAACGTSGGANTTLSNLTDTIAINKALIPGTAGALAFGSATKPWGDIYFAGTSGTPATMNFKLTGASTSGTRTITAPDANSVTVVPDTGSANNFLTAISAAGAISKAQPTWANIDKSTSSLGDLTTRASTNLSDSSNLVRNNAANTWSTGAQDFGSATSLKIPVGAGAAPATSGFIAYDSTNNNFHGGLSSADSKFASFTVTPAANDNCVKWVVSGSNYKLGDAGAACGTSGGANTTLSNLTDTIAINKALIPGTAAGYDFGSATKPWKDIYLAGTSGTPATMNFKITGASTSGTRTVTLPDANSVAVVPDTGSANNFLTAISAAGAISKAQPTWANIDKTTSSLADLATRASTNLSDGSAVAKNNQANTYTAGYKQTFQNSATTAGANLATSADPSSLAQGDLWLNASDLKFRGASATQTVERQANKDAASGYAGLTASTKLNASQGQEVWSVTDLTTYDGTSGSGSTAIKATFTSLTTNDVLTWSGTNWINQAASGGGANTTLSNLTDTVAINKALIPGTAGALDFGSPTKPWKDIYLAGTSGTPATMNFKITGASTSGTRTVTLPDANSVAVVPDTGSANNFLTAISAAGAISKARPTWADIDKTTSSLGDLTTRASTNLSDTSNLVRNNAGNTWSTGAQDFGSATSLKIPVGAGAAPTVSGLVAYDSTANTFKGGVNTATKTFAFLDSNITGTAAGLSATLGLSTGGTNQTSWTSSRCVQVNSGGTALESAAAACGAGGSGDNVSVNGTAATDADFDDATPAAPANAINVKWQKDAGTPNNLSAYVPYAAPLTVTGGNLTTDSSVVRNNQTNTYSAGTQDSESAAVTRPFRRLAYGSFPGSCTANREFLERSDPATAGQVVYVCNSAGTGWDLVGDGGGGGGVTSLDGLTGAVTTAIGTTGTAPNYTQATTIDTLNIPLAVTASVTAGLISKTQYDTFNGKPDLVTSGTAGVGPSKAGTAATAARSDHDHRSVHALAWFFPGTPATGVQNMTLTFPDNSLANIAIVNMRVTVNTTNAAASTFNIQRCTATCTDASPTFADIYSTVLTLNASTRTVAKGSAPDQNVSGLAAGDQFKANLVTIGSGLADVTVTMSYKYDTQN